MIPKSLTSVLRLTVGCLIAVAFFTTSAGAGIQSTPQTTPGSKEIEPRTKENSIAPFGPRNPSMTTSGLENDDVMDREKTGPLQRYFSSSLLADTHPNKSSLFNHLLSDQKNFYLSDSLFGLGLTFGSAAVVANTDWDRQIHSRFQKNVRGASSDEWFEFLHANKELGNGYFTLPIMGAAWLVGETIEGSPQLETLGDWGERSLRGFVVGALPLVVTQSVTGASRPMETAEGSKWNPFQDNNGVSGHAFMSSLPFITAAKMSKNPWKKTFWYATSALGPLSRVNDNAHYPSQAGLGWAIAYFAASAVDQTATKNKHWSVVPLNSPGYSGAGIEFRW